MYKPQLPGAIKTGVMSMEGNLLLSTFAFIFKTTQILSANTPLHHNEEALLALVEILINIYDGHNVGAR